MNYLLILFGVFCKFSVSQYVQKHGIKCKLEWSGWDCGTISLLEKGIFNAIPSLLPASLIQFLGGKHKSFALGSSLTAASASIHFPCG